LVLGGNICKNIEATRSRFRISGPKQSTKLHRITIFERDSALKRLGEVFVMISV